MPISAETQKAIDHYKAIRDLIGEEDLAHLTAFIDYAARTLPAGVDGEFLEFTETGEESVSDSIASGFGLLCDIMDPDGIAEQDEGFFDGDENEEETA